MIQRTAFPYGCAPRWSTNRQMMTTANGMLWNSDRQVCPGPTADTISISDIMIDYYLMYYSHCRTVDRIGLPTPKHTHKYKHPRLILTCSYLLFENIYIYETVHLVLGLLSNHKFNSHRHHFTHRSHHIPSRFQVHSIVLFMDTFGFHGYLVHSTHRHPS